MSTAGRSSRQMRRTGFRITGDLASTDTYVENGDTSCDPSDDPLPQSLHSVVRQRSVIRPDLAARRNEARPCRSCTL
jgi:hypothetical protein